MKTGKPEVHDGYTKVANEYLEALYADPLIDRRTRVRLYIERHTWGFGKKVRRLSQVKMARATGIDRRNLQRIISDLIACQRITCVKSNAGSTAIYGINKYYHSWKKIENRPASNTTHLPALNTTHPPASNMTHPHHLERKVLKKVCKESAAILFAPQLSLIELIVFIRYRFRVARALALWLLRAIRKNHSGFKKPDLNEWTLEFERTMRIDDRHPKALAVLISWAHTDKFWRRNILNPAALRAKYDRLVIEYRSQFPEAAPKTARAPTSEGDRKRQAARATAELLRRIRDREEESNPTPDDDLKRVGHH